MAEVKTTLFDATVAVTGGTGLLGSRLIASLLGAGAREVVVLLRKESNTDKLYSFLREKGLDPEVSGLRIAKFNMENPFEWARNLQGVDVVFHCAAVVAIGGVEASEIIAANRNLTARVVDGCLEAGVEKLVHVSSIATLGGARNRGRLVNENMRLDSFSESSAYTVSKFFAENQVLRARAMGLKTIIVHPAVILGLAPESAPTGSSAIIPQAISKGLFYTTGVMGYVDVNDVVRAMVMLADQCAAVGQNYILCAENIGYKQLMSTSRRAAGRSQAKIRVSRGFLKLVSHAERFFSSIFGFKPVITSDIVRNMTSKYLYDGSKIVRDFDFAYTPIDQTIEQVAKEYLTRK